MEDLKRNKISEYKWLGGFGGFGRILKKMVGVEGLKYGGFFVTMKKPPQSAKPPEEPPCKPVGNSRRRFRRFSLG